MAGTLVALVAPGSAEADDVKSFKPVHRTERSLVFKVRGVDAKQIVGAKALMRRKAGSRRVERRLSISRVRSAVNRKRLLRVRKPGSARGGRLSLTLERPAPAPGGSCAFGNFNANAFPGACWRPYSDSSPFNTPVAGKPTAPNSAAIVSRLMSFSATPDKISTGNADTEGDWSHPMYFSQPSDPLFTVHCAEEWGACEIEGMQVRIPDQAQPAGGGDGHMAVIDQASGWEYDFWQVRSKPQGGGQITISWGGRTPIGTADADGREAGATAAHFGLAAGVIRPAELAAGEIDHALFMVVECTNGSSVAPAIDSVGTTCSSIGLPNESGPAMGQHFYLDMSESEIAALPKPEWQKTILRAMARYGAYVGDTGGGGWGLQFESGSSYTSFGHADPWAAVGDRLGATRWFEPSVNRTLRIWDLEDAVDWARELRVATS